MAGADGRVYTPRMRSAGRRRGRVRGWFCPCHGSHYDTAGRIRKGPAPQNLLVPQAEFVDETTIKLG